MLKLSLIFNEKTAVIERLFFYIIDDNYCANGNLGLLIFGDVIINFFNPEFNCANHRLIC